MRLFLDTSALLKRYRDEPGSEVVRARSKDADQLGLSTLAMPEAISAFCRWLRQGEISAAQYTWVKQRLAADWADCSIVVFSAAIIADAIRLLEAWPLRAADALQLASARAWGPDLFLSADIRQCEAARGAGLHVELLT